MSRDKIKVGIVGGAGYTAGELIRLLVNHPAVELCFVHSNSSAGKKINEVHSGLIGDCDLEFSADFDLESIDLLFLCLAHGKSSEFWSEHPKPRGLKVIDLAQDYRDETGGYVYGLPEWQEDKIARARFVANPGCFATAIQLALLPLADAGLLNSEINVTAITGSTGAGVKPSPTTHFSWRSSNISTYKVFEHQHLKEICRNLDKLNGKDGQGVQINFIPMRGDFTRGIFAAIHLACPLSLEDAQILYSSFFEGSAFTFLSPRPIDLKEVVGTNKCLLFLEKHGDKLVITSAIDNLLKGASGQAVQNMNLLFGLDQKEGLRLKATAF